MKKPYCSVFICANNIPVGFIYCSICNNLVYHINNFFRENDNPLHFMRVLTANIDFPLCRSMD